MVEIIKKGDMLDFYFPSPFEQSLRDFFGSKRERFAMYWGGINGAINRKIGWDPDNENWFVDDDGIIYADSTNEIMAKETVYSFIGTEKRATELYGITREFISEYDVNPIFIDINSCDSLFDIEDMVKDHDLVFIKNVTMDVLHFLFKFDVFNDINYIYLFFTEDESKNIKEFAKERGNDSEGLHPFNEIFG